MNAYGPDVEAQAELQVMTDLAHETKKSEQNEETIAYATKEIAKYAKKMDMIIMGIIITLILVVGVKLLITFLKHKTMIMGIDKSGAKNWPSSGLGTAVAYDVPALAGWVGFDDKFLPVAAWMCYNYYSTNPYFQQYPGNCLDLMAMQYKYGGKGISGGNLSAMSLICGPQSWGASCIKPPLQNCEGQCKGGKVGVGDIVGSAVSGMSNGFFIGHGAVSGASGIAGIGGALIMGGIQVGQAYLNNHDSNKAMQDANNCAQ